MLSLTIGIDGANARGGARYQCGARVIRDHLSAFANRRPSCKWPISGLVTTTLDEPRGGKGKSGLCRCDGILPLRRRFGSKGPQRRSGDEVALKIERVVDGGVSAEEATACV
jgi:hypothetical protein